MKLQHAITTITMTIATTTPKYIAGQMKGPITRLESNASGERKEHQYLINYFCTVVALGVELYMFLVIVNGEFYEELWLRPVSENIFPVCLRLHCL